MAKITIYVKPTCSTCRNVHQALVEAKVDFDAVNYYIKPLSKAKLKELLRKMGVTARDILRRNTPLYDYFKLDDPSHTEAALIELMVQNPDLVQRPIVETSDRAILARPAERLKEIL